VLHCATVCGIAGLWGGRDVAALAPAMTSELVHRGPDADGCWVDEAAELALGHRRLSILDLSETGRQPMVSPDGRWVLTYNGEVYDFAELRDALSITGLRGTSDSEVLLRAAAEIGPEALCRRVNGMFAFALWDARERELWLARDRLGIKPLYWGRIGERFVFGSEPRAFRPVHGGDFEVDGAALALYARYGYLPGTRAILKGVHRLAPGHLLRVRRVDGRFEVDERRYWSIWDVDFESGPRDPREAAAQLDALLRDSVSKRLVADVEVGAFLSGGVDSSTVVALASEQAASIKTFSIGFHEREYDEAIYAKQIAGALGTDHHEHYVSPREALDLIPQLGDIYSEPFADSSQIPTTIVSRLARRHVKVSLSGDGGDELFAGYRQYAFLERIRGLAAPVPPPGRRSGGRAMRALARRARTSGALWRLTSSRAVRSNLVRAELLGGFLEGSARSVQALYESFVDAWRGEAVVRGHLDRAYNPVNGRARNLPPRMQMMLRDLFVYLPDDILTKVDRASMSCGLEARVPLLDHRVVEHAFALPYALKVRGDTTKWLLRRVLYERVDRSLIERPKMGFSVPIARWLRGELRDWAEALLDPTRLRSEGYFDVDVVRRGWDDHQRRRVDWSAQLWGVLMFQAWLDAEKRARRVPA